MGDGLRPPSRGHLICPFAMGWRTRGREAGEGRTGGMHERQGDTAQERPRASTNVSLFRAPLGMFWE